MDEPDHGTLFVCGTPIGNLGDVSDRLRTVLGQVMAVACEDTRVTRHLLGALGIPAPRLIAADEHRVDAASQNVHEILDRGGDVAFVSDAGMPGVSDPGARLVAAVSDHGHDVRVVPGPSAVSAMLALAGIGAEGYRFVGFLPRTAQALTRLLTEYSSELVIAFASPHRIRADWQTIRGCQPERGCAIGRELTKRHEELIHARRTADITPDDLREQGEYVLALAPMARSDEASLHAPDAACELARDLVGEGVRARAAARLAARHVGGRANAIYDALHPRD